MWWPRPRWKNDNICTQLILLLFITSTINTNAVMADNEQQCGGSNMSAVAWTTALCTSMLLVLAVVVYFVYCKRKKYNWTSLWWIHNPEKNLVLQTSAPTKDQQRQKNGGTDNPAFSADSCNVSDGRFTTVKNSSTTKIIRVPQSTIESQSLGCGLSILEENGKTSYLCDHNDGSKDRLVSVRLVFDSEHRYQSPLDLSRALIELSRTYGLHIELETVTEVAIPATVENCDETTDTNCKTNVKPNLLTAVCGKAHRLWQQRQMVFKGGDQNGKHNVQNPISNKVSCGDVRDLESGNVVAKEREVATVQKSACSSVTTFDETAGMQTILPPQATQNHSGSLQYRTLEYGASPSDMVAESSPDSSVQCITVNYSSEPVSVVKPADIEVKKTAAKDVPLNKTMLESEKDAQVSDKDVHSSSDKDTIDNVKTLQQQVKPTKDEPKHSAMNPPPPPPRKYNAPVVPPIAVMIPVIPVAPAINLQSSAPSTTTTTSEVTPDKAIPTSRNEIRMDEDYYWCTTTTMVAPPMMSTFGKRPSLKTDAVIGAADECSNNKIANVVVTDSVSSTASEVDPDGAGIVNPISVGGVDPVAASVVDPVAACVVDPVAPDLVNSVTEDVVDSIDMVDKRDIAGVLVAAIDNGGRDAVQTGGTTCSIEDASLPSFSSDEDEDDDCNGVFSEKQTKLVTENPSKVEYPEVFNDNNNRNKDDKITMIEKVNCNGIESQQNNDITTAHVVQVTAAAMTEPKSPVTKLPTLRLSLSSSQQQQHSTSTSCSSSASSTSPSPTNNNISPIVSKIPVRRQSAGSTTSAFSCTPPPSMVVNGSAKKSIPLPLSRSGSRLAMWSPAN